MKRNDRRSARERLLAAADELFYNEGVNAVGIDRVIEQAGVAKASLYSIFGSKDELVRTYLTERHGRWKQRVDQELAERYSTPRERLLGVFDVLGRWIVEPGYRGCAFINAAAEARPGSRVEKAVDEYRTWLHGLFLERAQAAGAGDPEHLAQQLVLLYDGASVVSCMDRDRAAAAKARAVAAVMVDAAIPPAASKRASGLTSRGSARRRPK
jgi:AcrR family transcriptional regulator